MSTCKYCDGGHKLYTDGSGEKPYYHYNVSGMSVKCGNHQVMWDCYGCHVGRPRRLSGSVWYHMTQHPRQGDPEALIIDYKCLAPSVPKVPSDITLDKIKEKIKLLREQCG
jgi:hypothetical protein